MIRTPWSYMGTAIGEILHKQPLAVEDLKNRKVGVDAYNIFYQFLAIIRGPDGTPLMNSKGQITSHLSGLLYRNITLLENNVQPVFVFDGKPHELKRRTIKERIEAKQEAEEKFKEAKETEEIEDMRKFAMQTTRITPEILDSGKKLLSLLGIPIIQAPSEGEAQVSQMVNNGILHACVSQDFDSLLFGSKKLVRNLTMTGKRKVPRRNIYVEVKPELIDLDENLRLLNISREKLIWLGILVGTDFNDKFPRIGAKTGLKLIQKFDSFEDIIKETKHEPNFDYKEIEDIFLHPKYSEDFKLEWIEPDKEGILKFLCDENDFSRERIEPSIDRLIKTTTEQKTQKNLSDWFGKR